MSWLRYNDNPPVAKVNDVFLFRAKHRSIPVMLNFTAKIITMFDGVANTSRLLPAFANWDGWKHTIPVGLEWQPYSGDKQGGCDLIGIEGFKLLPCPFCGSPVSWNPYYGGDPCRMEHFGISHCIAMVSTHDPARTAERWNRRAA